MSRMLGSGVVGASSVAVASLVVSCGGGDDGGHALLAQGGSGKQGGAGTGSIAAGGETAGGGSVLPGGNAGTTGRATLCVAGAAAWTSAAAGGAAMGSAVGGAGAGGRLATNGGSIGRSIAGAASVGGGRGGNATCGGAAGAVDCGGAVTSVAGGTGQTGAGAGAIPSGVGMGGGGNASPLLDELACVCSLSGGRFENGDCACPTEQAGAVQVRQNFSARAGGSCVRPTLTVHECIARGGFEHVLDAEGLEALRTCVTSKDIYSFQFSKLRLRVPDDWQLDDARALARWLDARLTPPSSLYVRLGGLPDAIDYLVAFVGHKNLAQEPAMAPQSLYQSAFKPLPSVDPGTVSTDLDRVIGAPPETWRYLHVPSPELLDSALGNAELTAPAGRNTTPAPEAGELGQVIERAIAETRLDTTQSVTVTPYLKRCLDLCDVRQDYQLGGGTESVAVWRDRIFLGGVTYRETLAVGSPDHLQVHGLVVFDLGGQPSLIFRVDYTNGRLKPTVSAYDRNWVALGSVPFDLLPDAAEATAATRAAAASATARSPAEGEVGVVLCGSGILFNDPQLNSALLYGPQATDALGNGSLLGWLDAPAHDAAGFLDGVRTTLLGFMPIEAYPKIHDADIAKILVQASPAIRVLPITASRCIRDANALAFIASTPELSAKIRIVSLSAADFVDTEACQTRFPDGLDPHFLWVTAAGNSFRKYTAETPLARCPQDLAPRSNLIVVGTAGGTSLLQFGDYGPNYADIAAECTPSTGGGNCQGTSNSAPRVSGVAALIMKEHGAAISNAMVRMAILLGATVPARALPLRSGGVLNLDGAQRAARELVTHGLGTRETLVAAEAAEVLKALYPDAATATNKLTILQQNGAFTSQ